MCANICVHHFGNPKLCQLASSVSVGSAKHCASSLYNVNGHLKWRAHCSSSVRSENLSLWGRQVFAQVLYWTITLPSSCRVKAWGANGTMTSQERASSGLLVVLLKGLRRPTWEMIRAKRLRNQRIGWLGFCSWISCSYMHITLRAQIWLFVCLLWQRMSEKMSYFYVLALLSLYTIK